MLCFCVRIPLNTNELVLSAPFQEEGGASRAHSLAHRQQQNRKSHTLKILETLSSGVQPYMFSHL